MEISCPQCAATYRVPDTLIAARRSLRCAACGHSWVPEAPAAAPAARAAPPPAPAAPLPQAAPPPKAAPPPPEPRLAPAPAARDAPAEPIPPPVVEPRPGRRRLRAPALRLAPLPLAWGGSVLSLGGMLAAMVALRGEIAAAWPPFGRVVLLLGG
jgi:predicted Zn finger-like uncharacterized protein